MLAIKRFFRWEDKTNISDNDLYAENISTPLLRISTCRPSRNCLFSSLHTHALIQVLTDSRNEYTFHDSIQT